MQKTISVLFLVIFIFGCGETEFETNTRQEYSSIIRRIDTNYQNLIDNKEQEENLSMMKARDFYSAYTDKFSEIRDDLAGAPNAEKFKTIHQSLDSVITTSNKYVNNRQSILMGTFKTTNAFSQYRTDLEQFVDYMVDFDRYSSVSVLESRKSDVLKDSIEFYTEFNQLEQTIKEKDEIVDRLIKQSNNLNKIATQFDFRDSLNFHKKYLGDENIFTESWDNLQNIKISPSKDLGFSISDN